MKKQFFVFAAILFGFILDGFGQAPPQNPFLINSPFPMVHQNNYRQGYSELPSIANVDSFRIRTATTPFNRVSPWLQPSETYQNGQRVIWGSTSTHIFKAISTPDTFQVVSTYTIDFDPSINDLSWALLQMPEHKKLTYDDERLLLFSEADTTDPLSPIVLLQEVFLPTTIGNPAKLTRMYNGSIAFASETGVIGLLNDNLQILDTLRLNLGQNETSFHNDFASDETGGIYTVTTERMIRLQITNNTLSVDWEIPMAFGGNVNQRVGTTPTLLGTDDDRLVCMVNSKTPAELIAFWRDDIPNDWTGINGQNIRVAAIVPLPGSGPISPLYAAVENSPVAHGYGIACAQYNGLLGQNCNNSKGIYKLEWNTTANSMDIQWVRSDINMNSVLALSISDNVIYGSGREADCNYYYYCLDWNTGTTVKSFKMGNNADFDDPGNANIILEDSSIVYNSKEKLIQLYPVHFPEPTAITELAQSPFQLFPNPTTGMLNIVFEDGQSPKEISLTDLMGRKIQFEHSNSGITVLDMSSLSVGSYILNLTIGNTTFYSKIIKQ